MPGIKVATTAPEKMGRAAYVAYHKARGAEYPETDWAGLDESSRRPWIKAALAVVRDTNVRVPVAIELMRLEAGLAEKLIRHGYGQNGEMLPTAILAVAIPPVSDVPCGTGEDNGDHLPD